MYKSPLMYKTKMILFKKTELTLFHDFGRKNPDVSASKCKYMNTVHTLFGEKNEKNIVFCV